MCSGLLMLLEKLISWIYDGLGLTSVRISLFQSRLETFLDYFLKLDVGPDIAQICRECCFYDARRLRFGPPNHKKIAEKVARFLQDHGELLRVPTPQQLSPAEETLAKNEVVAGFIGFLLRLLHPDPYLLASFPVMNDDVIKELRFLATILGDGLFQSREDEQVQILLGEFEQVANVAGGLVQSLIFDPMFKTIDEALNALLEHIRHLKANIVKFLNLMPIIVDGPRANSVVDSGSSLDSLLHNLEDLMSRDDDRFVEVMDHIRMLHQQLMRSQSLLQHSKFQNAVSLQIRNMACEAEYLIDSFLVGDLPLWYLTLRLTHYVSNIELNATKLQEIEQDYDIGALKVTEDFCAQQSLQDKKDSLVDDIIVGFEQQKGHILDHLQWGPKKLQLILIYGMPGIGKTTLAGKVYSASLVRYHFDKTCWCVVSQIYRRRNLLIDILACIRSDLTEDSVMKMDEDGLEVEIYKTLKDRRYFIVMDDIWDSKAWDDIWRFFPDDGNGSRILFTSRNRDVAPCGSTIHELPFLSNDQCWKLLEKKVFHNGPCPPQLYKIGKKIAANCHGLPLAVVVIAGILSTIDKEESAWENVRRSLDSYLLSDESSIVMQILELSYKHLPRHLKPCFLYFGVFEEDAKIPVRRLMQL